MSAFRVQAQNQLILGERPKHTKLTKLTEQHAPVTPRGTWCLTQQLKPFQDRMLWTTFGSSGHSAGDSYLGGILGINLNYNLNSLLRHKTTPQRSFLVFSLLCTHISLF